MLLGSPYAVQWVSISFGRGCHGGGGQLLADTRRQIECSTSVLTCLCHFSLDLLITSPIASTPRCLLGTVLGCLSFRET